MDEVCDLSHLDEQLNDRETMLEIVDRYMEHLEKQITRLEAIHDNPDSRSEVHRIAHCIRGGAGNIGAPLLSGLAGELEKSAKGSTVFCFLPQILALKTAYDETRKSITHILQEHNIDKTGSLRRG